MPEGAPTASPALVSSAAGGSTCSGTAAWTESHNIHNGSTIITISTVNGNPMLRVSLPSLSSETGLDPNITTARTASAAPASWSLENWLDQFLDLFLLLVEK